MIKLKYIVVFLVLTSAFCFSQTSFNNLDSLFTKSFDAVSKRDSVRYLSIINQTAVFKEKKVKTTSDTLKALAPFLESFRDLLDELTELSSDPDFSVKYLNYEYRNKNIAATVNGKLLLHVNLVVNDNFTVKMPMVVYVNNSQYSIESPMAVMFAEGKE